MNSIKDKFQNTNPLPASNAPDNRKVTAQKDSRNPKMLEAARSFENQFIRQMISEMRKTIPKDEVVGESMADGIYRDQLDNEYADMWVNQGGVGLADMIYDQLFEKYGHPATPAAKAPGEFLPLKSSKVQEQSAAKKESLEALGSNGLKNQEIPRSKITAKLNSPIPSESVLPGARKELVGQSVEVENKNAAVNVGATAQVSRPETSSSRPHDILSQADKQLFLLKMSPDGFAMKSKEPLPESVNLRSPLSGMVLQAAALDDGRQMIVVRHDQGLVSQFVHTGNNHVKTSMRVAAGEIIAELPASQNGESANVLFKLRKAANPE